MRHRNRELPAVRTPSNEVILLKILTKESERRTRVVFSFIFHVHALLGRFGCCQAYVHMPLLCGRRVRVSPVLHMSSVLLHETHVTLAHRLVRRSVGVEADGR